MGGWRGWIRPGTPTRPGAWCGAVLPWAGWWVWGRCREPFSSRTPSRGVWKVVRVEGTSSGYPKLVAGIGDDSRCGQHPGASLKDTGLFWASPVDEWGTWHWHLHWQLLSGPTAPHCLCQKDFLSLPDLRFPCQDLCKEQWKKTVAYAQALQCWAARANLPMPGQPCLLVGSVLELHKKMEQYISFSNDIILGSVALLEEFFGSQTSISRDTPPASTNVPSKEVTLVEVAPIIGPLEESTMPWVLHEKQAKMEAPPNQFPSWEKVLHPSQPVTALRQTPLALDESKQRHCHWSSEARRARHQRAEEQLQAEMEEWDSPSPESPEPMHAVVLPLGFEEVIACLQRDPLPAIALRCPWNSHSQKQSSNPQ